MRGGRDVVTATVSESDNWLIEQAVAEYEALRAGGPGCCVTSIETVGGKVEFCGVKEDIAHSTMCYVPHGQDGVLPLVVGAHDICFARFEAIDRNGRPYWDPRSHPPLVAIVGGARRPFRPARGRFVVGVIEASGYVLLLAAVGESLAVIHLAGKTRTVVYSGRPLTFGEVDVDRMIRWRRAREVGHRPAPRVRPSAKVRDYHLRIVGAVEVDVGDGPSIDAVLSHGFRVLEWRARTVKPLGERRKRRGKTKLGLVLDAFLKVILTGGGIFEGGPGDLLGELRARCPNLAVDVETFSNVLGLLVAADTCLVKRPTRRDWRLSLSADLRDPRSDLHRRFCEETVGRVRKLVAGEVLTEAHEGAANESSQAARPRSTSTGTRTRRRATAAASASPTTACSTDQSTPAPPTAAESAAMTRAAAAPAPPSDPTTPSDPDSQPTSSSPAEAERSASSDPSPVTSSSRTTDLDLDLACSSPTRAAESLYELIMKISSRIEDECDPFARRLYEITFTAAMCRRFASEGGAPGVVAESARRFFGGLAAAAQRTPSAPEEPIPVDSATGEPATVGTEDESSNPDPYPERGAVEIGERADEEAEQLEDSKSEGTDDDLAPRMSSDTTVADVDRKVAASQLDDAGTRADVGGDVDAVGGDGYLVEAEVDRKVAASQLDDARTRADVGVAVDAVGEAAPQAPALGGLAEHAPPGADHEDGAAERTRVFIDADRLDARPNTGLPAGASARCDARPDHRPPGRRPLFASVSCVVLHAQGWTAPVVAEQPVPLARFGVPAPICDPQAINDGTCMVTITTDAPEIAQGPRGPPGT